MIDTTTPRTVQSSPEESKEENIRMIGDADPSSKISDQDVRRAFPFMQKMFTARACKLHKRSDAKPQPQINWSDVRTKEDIMQWYRVNKPEYPEQMYEIAANRVIQLREKISKGETLTSDEAAYMYTTSNKWNPKDDI